MRRPKRVGSGDGGGGGVGSGSSGGGGGGDVGSGRSGARRMRSIPIDNRIYGGKLAREGDGIGDARVRGNLEEMEASAVRRTLKLSSRSAARLLHLRSLLFFVHLFSFLSSSSSSLSLSLFFLFSSVSFIPISTFSSYPRALFRRLNQPAEEMARRGG